MLAPQNRLRAGFTSNARKCNAEILGCTAPPPRYIRRRLMLLVIGLVVIIVLVLCIY